jgi:diguanylate cyclase (GGDEF)-like protein/PAS domain S-box-containing protein
VFESTSEGVLITDVEGVITAVNRAFTTITGYSAAEVLGKSPKLLRSERHSPEFFEEMWRAIQAHGSWQNEVWNRRSSGEVFPVWQSVSAVRNGAGEVTHYVSVFTDISSLKRTQEQLNYLAYHDPLTELPNRLLFNDRLAHALERAARANDQLALLFVDLDNFKNVNDSLGHPVGDALLMQVAARLRHLARKDDTVARLSGDEFVIVLENIHAADDTVILARKLIDAFNQPFTVQGHELHVTLSIGISLYPRDGRDVETLVRNADAALYRAKEEGRNNFYYYTEELTSTVLDRLRIEAALRNAIKNQELVLHYQPQLSLATGRIIGVEALLRWQHPELGLLPPARFIGRAEDSGLIIPIGEWVLATACRQMRRWQQQGYNFGRMAVNVSGLQLQRGDFQRVVNEVLLDTQLGPQYLELEITENFIMHKTELAIAILDSLKGLGIQIAIDDFGTGYSSLSYLKRLPVDKLKIDQSFVRDIPQDRDDEAIACAVVALAKALELKVIAEGVETEEQRQFLLAQGCDDAQGFLFSRPLPAADLPAWADRLAVLAAP